MKILRLWRGFTQQDVADRIKLTRLSVTNAEAGRQRMPLWNLLKLSVLYGVPAHIWLLAPEEWAEWCKKANVTCRVRRHGVDVYEVAS